MGKNYSDIGTITDMDGKYTISVPAEANTIGFSFMGMKKNELEIGGRTTINGALESEDQLIDDVIVTVVARNVVLLHSNADGFDPEQVNSISNGSPAYEGGSLPSSRSIGFNINLKF